MVMEANCHDSCAKSKYKLFKFKGRGSSGT